ncbi:MAG TPA: NAD(P)-binding domain-containing protein, partial [Pseudomonadales bacterium]|nr:NAD(P)-binding domain-containing protein [Pseudomonadales bacterium]
MARLAFIGLGVMGYPMAAHLARAGHSLRVFNRTPARAERWVAEFGGERASSPAQATRDAEVVFCCLGDDHSVRDVVLGTEGVLATFGNGALLVDHT